MTICRILPDPDRPADSHRGGGRLGFTILEILIALGILLTVLGVVARTVAWGLGERDRKVTQQRALETAANILEAARACPWDQLNAAWAKSQKVPESLTGDHYLGQVDVRVETEPARPLTKRVTAIVRWQHGEETLVQSIQLVGLFSARAGQAEGSKK